MGKKRHLTKREIIERCKAVAREKRMVDRTPWTIMSALCSFCIMEAENYKRQRMIRIINKVNELEEQWNSGLLDLKDISDVLFSKANMKIASDSYKEEDIKWKKGSFDHWLDSRQIETQNEMNMQASRYMMFFYYTLITEFGFGEKRISRVDELVEKNMKIYQRDKNIITDWKKSLKENAGLAIEMPVDPLTHTSGSLMTG